jgi:hypothetical protein
MKVDVLSAMHFIVKAWRFLTHNEIKNRLWSVVSWLMMPAAMKLSEDEEDDWQFTAPWSVVWGLHNMWQCPCVCAMQNVDQVVDQHFTRPENEPEEEEE